MSYSSRTLGVSFLSRHFLLYYILFRLVFLILHGWPTFLFCFVFPFCLCFIRFYSKKKTDQFSYESLSSEPMKLSLGTKLEAVNNTARFILTKYNLIDLFVCRSYIVCYPDEWLCGDYVAKCWQNRILHQKYLFTFTNQFLLSVKNNNFFRFRCYSKWLSELLMLCQKFHVKLRILLK